MTRNEFLEEVNWFDDLLNFDSELGLYICDDIYDQDTMNDYVNEHLYDLVDDCDGWEWLRDYLDNIPNGADYYILDDYGEWSEAGDYEFTRRKEEILDYCDDHDLWDEEDDEEELEETTGAEEEVDENELPAFAYADNDECDSEEDTASCSLTDLFTDSIVSLKDINEAMVI